MNWQIHALPIFSHVAVCALKLFTLYSPGCVLPEGSVHPSARGPGVHWPWPASSHQRWGKPLHLSLEHPGAISPDPSWPSLWLPIARRHCQRLRRLRRSPQGVLLRPLALCLQGHSQLPGCRKTAFAAGDVRPLPARWADLLGCGDGVHGALLQEEDVHAHRRGTWARAARGGAQAKKRHAAGASGGDKIPEGDELAERYGGESSIWVTREDLRLHVSHHGCGDCHQLVYQHHARPQGGRE